MPWLMPSSTRGAGGFVASAALKRSSTITRSAPTPENAERRTRPATMYSRSSHQRNFGGSITSTRSLSPRKSQFSDFESERPVEKPLEPKPSPPREPSPEPADEESMEEQIPPTPPPHKTPFLPRSEMKSPSKTSQSSQIEPSPSQVERSPSPPLQRIPTSTSTDPLSPKKRWSPTKSSWLDSALQKANDPTPGSPPKRTNSIRPIPPAVPQQPKWTNERTAKPPAITKSTSFTSALGGMGGRRDVTGINPTSTTSTSTIESRIAALEKKTPPRQTLRQSQSLRETLKPLSPTPSPPTVKPKWEPPTDPVKERLLAARSGLSKAPNKPTTFSDPLKEGILAAKEKLRVQDKPREERQDELKMSILNARKGLKKATSAESEGKRESSPGVRGREKSPVVEVKQEEVAPKKTTIASKPAVSVTSKPQSPPSTKPVVKSTRPTVQRSPKSVVHPTKPVETVATKPVEQTVNTLERPATESVQLHSRQVSRASSYRTRRTNSHQVCRPPSCKIR